LNDLWPGVSLLQGWQSFTAAFMLGGEPIAAHDG
jgi:hypothetical protein